ncbi:hypothetical protein EYF80_062505 [Liparis tanakae]|uniref:Uncharacterized protein n=1 Tax=Liparis tanakae TaxID=230148 RepID=A0A4Z2EFP2_9TELE|nr:hypothetical protein EYF80_062505 [Liparis tanakae]
MLRLSGRSVTVST